ICLSSFSFNASATTATSTLSLHDALPIYRGQCGDAVIPAFILPSDHNGSIRIYPTRSVEFIVAEDKVRLIEDGQFTAKIGKDRRSEEHTSELQSRENLVCRLLLEKKNKAR